ncbi:MAG TPA: hypothetical protein VMF50_16935 [Candidatus Binataceae bacterium]|nr:hypothetical protein [Candidatus Binataceae bacterium]
MILLGGCAGVQSDPMAVGNRNLYLVPNNSPYQGQVERNAPLVVVCGTNDPRNPEQNLGWGAETGPRCWYGRPATIRMPLGSPSQGSVSTSAADLGSHPTAVPVVSQPLPAQPTAP